MTAGVTFDDVRLLAGELVGSFSPASEVAKRVGVDADWLVDALEFHGVEQCVDCGLWATVDQVDMELGFCPECMEEVA